MFEQAPVLGWCQACEKKSDAHAINKHLLGTGEPFVVFAEAPVPVDMNRFDGNFVKFGDLCLMADIWKGGSSPVVLALLPSHALFLPNGPGTMIYTGATCHGRLHMVSAPKDMKGDRMAAASSLKASGCPQIRVTAVRKFV